MESLFRVRDATKGMEVSSLLISSDLGDSQWTSLLDALGTATFKKVLKRFLTNLVGPQACATFFHETLGELTICPDCTRTLDLPLAVAMTGCHERDSLHWIHFEDGLSIGIAGPMYWSYLSELSRRLAGTGEILAAIVRKHLEFASGSIEDADPDPFSCLTSIEQCLAECTELSAREVEVCSRILFGLTSAEIAVDLHICETTIKTYRKRAYQRLSIGCERELTSWYLRTRAQWKHTPGVLLKRNLRTRGQY